MKYSKILVVDFGGHNTQLLARRIREKEVFCEVVAPEGALRSFEAEPVKGIILAGGGAAVSGAPALNAALLACGVPVLGINYGARAMVLATGGSVEKKPEPEGLRLSGTFAKHTFTGDAPAGSSEQIARLPEGFVITAGCDACPTAVIEDSARSLYAVQFEPQLDAVSFGEEVLQAFVFDVCGCASDWTPKAFVENAIADIRAQVGDKKVLCAISGGVDSTVCAVLTHRAIGDALTCVFVDHGLMRLNEGDEVMETLTGRFNMKVYRVNAQDRFLAKLAGVSDPEQKRKIIGYEFIDVFTDETKKLGHMDFLLQGTIYPDILESGIGSGMVKSHHNVGGLPEKLGFALLEPVRLLFKDEVRRVGAELGIPAELVNRQPFPGPGLGVRCLGEVTKEKLDILRHADAIVREEIIHAGLDKSIWQYFAILPGIQSVGVKNDARTWCHAVGIRAIHSIDAMTAQWAHIPYEVLECISARIVAEVPEVNRVVYDITSKPPATIEWE